MVTTSLSTQKQINLLLRLREASQQWRQASTSMKAFLQSSMYAWPSSCQVRQMRRCDVRWSPFLCKQCQRFSLKQYLMYGGTRMTRQPLRSNPQRIQNAFCHKNLAAGLLRFRYASGTRVLRIDSICINQRDVDEKNVQVPLMGEVYGAADRVLVWLGEEEDVMSEIRTNCAIRQMHVAYIRCKQDSAANFTRIEQAPYGLPNTIALNEMFDISRPSQEYFHDKLSVPRLFFHEFQAILRLFRHPWFSRAKTWQEAYVAKHVFFLRGSMSWSRQNLLVALNMFIKLHELAGLGPEFPDTLSKVGGMLICEVLITKDDKARKFSSILKRRRGAQCKLPSDIVYSVMDAAIVKPRICVDYNLSFGNVYARATSQIILVDGTLSILGELDLNRPEDTNLPTWTLDWRKGPASPRGLGLLPLYAATGSSRAILRSTNNEEVLTVQGSSWDTIRSTSPYLIENTRNWAIKELTSPTDLEHSYLPTHEPLMAALFRVQVLDNTSFDTNLPLGRWRSDSFSRMQEIVKNSPVDEQSKQEYAKIVSMLYFNKISSRLFVTHGGRLGMADRTTEAGDSVVMLLGGDVAYILRNTGTDQHYTLVSRAYVHGYMDGEALIDARQAADSSWDASDTAWLKDPDMIQNCLEFETFHIH